MFALAARRPVEDEPEPVEIVQDRLLVFALAAGSIQVFNAQQQTTADFSGEALVHER